FLFKLDSDGNPTTEMNDEGGYFDLAPIDTSEDCRQEIARTLEEIGFEVEMSHHEAGPRQHEISFKYADAVTACDNIQTFKLVAKTITSKNNMHTTYITITLYGIADNGIHDIN